MAEVRTVDVKAVAMGKEAFRAENVPGSFFVSPADEDGDLYFYYRCPCGCGGKSLLLVGDGFKPADGPSWQWNGSLAAPTLQPSIHHFGHWHGWLTDGIWRSV